MSVSARRSQIPKTAAVKTLTIHDERQALQVYGLGDQHLRLLEKSFGVEIFARGSALRIKGAREGTGQAVAVLERLIAATDDGLSLAPEQVQYAIRMAKNHEDVDLKSIYKDPILISPIKHRVIKPKTEGQRRYVEAVRRHAMVFGVGPAGTGKTFLAVAMAVAALTRKEVSRIILVRPAVEAGERLGFLPGDLQAKVDPYFRPLYDALFEMMGIEKFHKLMGEGVIEVAPLAYMRGRTLNDAFIILDEAQNTTIEQMKMFLTRMGFNSKIVVTGDVTQIDLPTGKASGLVQVQAILRNVDDIRFVYLTGLDVVRHELVQQIMKAYDKFDNGSKSGGGAA